MPMSEAAGMPRDRPSGISARVVAAWLYSSIDATNSPMANVQGAALAMLLEPRMMVSWLALMKVSPSQARPRMPMIAVTPDWQVLHFGTSATGARVNVRISAATANMTIA